MYQLTIDGQLEQRMFNASFQGNQIKNLRSEHIIQFNERRTGSSESNTFNLVS